jgi:hypothetical protein
MYQTERRALTKPEDFYPPYNSRKQDYPLSCDLSPQEIEERRLQLGKVSTERGKLATKHAAEMAKWKEEHKKLEAEFDSLCEQLGTGMETREIECEWEVDVKRKTASLRRLDTKAFVFKGRRLSGWQLQQLAQERLPGMTKDEEPESEDDSGSPTRAAIVLRSA